MVNYCRYCGHEVEIAQLFTPTQQRIFEFIWRNPGCSLADISTRVYGTVHGVTVIKVHLVNITRGLESTEYQLTGIGDKSLKTARGAGNPPKRYSIQPRTLSPPSAPVHHSIKL